MDACLHTILCFIRKLVLVRNFSVKNAQEFSAAMLGDGALMEKSWQDTGMLVEAVLHAHV